MKTAAIIQARMGSTRLPGKVLMKLNGIIVLNRLIDRIRLAKEVDEVIVATGFDFANDKLRRWCYHNKIKSYSGPEEDVLERVTMCALFNEVDKIVEITGDCPLVDPKHIDLLCSKVNGGVISYASNIFPQRTWPDGFDVQVYETKTLVKIHEMLDAKNPHREHVGWNITNYLKVPYFVHAACAPDYVHPKWGLTLDTEPDLHLLDCIFGNFDDIANIWFSAEDVIDYLNKNLGLLTINMHVKRKEVK